jgi:hypothetical protein
VSGKRQGLAKLAKHRGSGDAMAKPIGNSAKPWQRCFFLFPLNKVRIWQGPLKTLDNQKDRGGDLGGFKIFSCRHFGNLALNNIISCRQLLAICLPINFISCRQSGEQGTPKIHFLSPAAGSISFFIANLAKFRHYFEHCKAL